MIIAVIFGYLLLVLAIGLFSHKFFRKTGEDYFVASRSIGPFILLMTLFGTNMTAFAILGASGEAYHDGIGVFGLMASASALVIPTIFYFVGTRVWAVGKKNNYLTQVQFFRDRWGSKGLGLLLFVVLVALMIPYLLIGVMGAGIALNQITSGQIPEWAGGLVVSIVILTYVSFGGLRGTSWVNTFQTCVFMVLGGLAFFVIVRELGGMSAVMDAIAEKKPDLLIRGDHITPMKFLTYTCIPLSVGMFPHMFMHWLSAKKARTFRYPLMFYPMCIAAVWIPSVLLGIMGVIDFEGLKGPAANSVLIKMVELYAPGVLGGLLAAGIFAAIMSSLDSQVLSVGTMFTQDIVAPFGFKDKMSETQQVLVVRIFEVIIVAVTYVLALVVNRSIFSLAVWSFSGYAALFPVVIAALFWKRSTKIGAFASIVSVAVLWLYFFLDADGSRTYTVGDSGIMPVAVILVVSTAAMIIGSLLSKPPEDNTLRRFFPTSKTALADNAKAAN